MRPKLFNGAKTRAVDLYLTDELVEVLRAVAERHALTPAAYARSLLVTHLNRQRATEDESNVQRA